MTARTEQISAKASFRPGVLPADARFNVADLTGSSEKVNEIGNRLVEYLGADPASQSQAIMAIHPFDIGFTDPSGTKIEPEGTVMISLDFSVPIAAGTETNKSIWRIFHVPENGGIEELTGAAATKIVTVTHGAVQSVSFQSAAFSDYVLAEMTGIMTLDETGNISEHLVNAGIKVNGEPYDGVSALNPGEQFSVSLEWQLNRDDLTKTRIYTYVLPEQIKVEDVAEAILFDDNYNRKGVYSIKNGVLTVEYDNVSDVNTTSFELDATWNRENIEQKTTVRWNDILETQVKFDNAQIAVTKKMITTKTETDGSYVGEYAVNVTASGNVPNITLKDTMISDTVSVKNEGGNNSEEKDSFHFYKGYYKNDGETYDYRYIISNSDGNTKYQYGNFPSPDADGTITFPQFSLSEGQTYTVEYAVKLDGDIRFMLDQNLTPTSLTNTATASYPYNDENITSSVTVKDTYRAEKNG